MGFFGALLITTIISPAGDTTYARLSATIGENAPRTPFFIGEVSGLALDDAGRLYISDFQEPRVVVFAPDGRQLGIIGRKGQGPGEFTAPTGPFIAPDGSLWVRNMDQVAHFVVDAKTGLPTKFDRAFRGPALAPWRSKVPSLIDRAGRFYFPREVGGRDGLTHHAYLRFRLDGQQLDSLGVPLHPTARSEWAFYSISQGTGKMVPGLAVVPFHPLPVWAATPAGTMLSGPADKYELIETGPDGRSIHTITRVVPPMPIPVGERSDSLRALKSRLDSLPVPMSALMGASEEVRALRLPEHYPFYRGLAVDPSTGEVWVRRWSAGVLAHRTVVDVFTATGSYMRTVVLPMDCAPQPGLVVRGGSAACVQVDPESGAESVVLAQFRK